ncbi:hypothetical protein [Virgibacillus sediminis]|uniref:3-methyladenine DNA glycosylase n=1 Tax=Virgibacillus sediminis TaxID=202260 RepID=A0ABV7A250_9BACI
MADNNEKKHNYDSPEQEMKKKDPEQDISPQRENDTSPKQNKNHK